METEFRENKMDFKGFLNKTAAALWSLIVK